MSSEKFTIFAHGIKSPFEPNFIQTAGTNNDNNTDGLPPKYVPASIGTPANGALITPNSLPPMRLTAPGQSITFTNIYKTNGTGLFLRTPTLILGLPSVGSDLKITINGTPFTTFVTAINPPQNIDIPIDSFTSPLTIIYEAGTNFNNILGVYEPTIFQP